MLPSFYHTLFFHFSMVLFVTQHTQSQFSESRPFHIVMTSNIIHFKWNCQKIKSQIGNSNISSMQTTIKIYFSNIKSASKTLDWYNKVSTIFVKFFHFSKRLKIQLHFLFTLKIYSFEITCGKKLMNFLPTFLSAADGVKALKKKVLCIVESFF
jgi:hypothetical protein